MEMVNSGPGSALGPAYMYYAQNFAYCGLPIMGWGLVLI